MKSTILITPTSNIKDSAVINNDKVEKRTYDSDMDVFTFYNVVSKEKRKSNLMDVSLYDDLIIESDVEYKILQMVSKN